MRSSPKHYAKLLLDKSNSAKNGDELNITIKAFASFLDQEGMLSKLPEIIKLFNKFWNKKHKTVDAEIIVSSLESIKDTQLHLPKEVQANITENKNLIGGLTIRIEDYFIDNSIKGNIIKLKESLR